MILRLLALLVARWTCGHHEMIRVRDTRGYGAECPVCGYYRVFFRSVQPPAKPPLMFASVKSKRTPADVIPIRKRR